MAGLRGARAGAWSLGTVLFVARSDHAEAVRKFVTRLVAVVVVVAGLIVLIAPLCDDGMSMVSVGDTGSVSASFGAAQDHGRILADSSYCDVMVVGPAVAHCGPGTASLLSSPLGGPMPAGAILVCIVIVMAILPVLFAFRPRWLIRTGLIRPAERMRLVVRAARQPLLAELCVLRT